MTDSENKTCGDEPLRGIVSDVSMGDPEHDRLIHEFAERINKHVDDKPDAPKIKNRCGDCVAFHTPFCTWEETNPDRPPYEPTRIVRNDVACCRFYPRLKTPKVRRLRFDEVVDNL